jgi:hypothetical protein
MIPTYIDDCYKKRNIDENKTMLEFLDNMSKTSKYNDDAIDNLLCV